MALVGCYSLDLYCDRDGDIYGYACRKHRGDFGGGPTAEYIGRTESDCLRQARSDGWKFDKDRVKAICPACAAEGIRP